MSTPALVLENQPVCNICYQKPVDPVILPCQHQFCRRCMKRQIVASPEAERFRGFGCPVCQEFVQKPLMAGSRPKEQWAEYLPSATLSNKKPDLLSSQEDDLKCASCREAGLNKAATLWCQQCNDSYCPDCSASHRNFPATRSHVQVPIAYISPRDRGKEAAPTCPEHRDSRVEFYCAACDKLICPSCAFVNHRKCEKVSTLTGATKTAKGDLSTKIQRVRKRSTECQALLKDNKNKIAELHHSRQRTEANINVFTDQLMDSISANRDNMLANISHSFNTEENRLHKTKTKIEEHLTELEGCEQGIENLLNSNSETEILSNLSKTQRQYDSSIDKDLEADEIVPFKIDFEPNTSLLDVLDSSQIGETVMANEPKDTPQRTSDEPIDQLKQIKIKAKERKSSKQKVKFKKSKRSRRRGSEGNSAVPLESPVTSVKPSEELRVERVKAIQKYKTISTDILGDSLKSSPSSIVVLFVNGVRTIVVADHNNYCLKSFYTNMGLDRQSKMSLDSKPCHIAIVDNNKIVSTMKRIKKIAVIKVSPTLTLLDRIRTSKYYNCIGALADDRLVVGTSLEAEVAIDIIDLEGNILHSILSHSEDKLLFSEAKYLTITSSGTIMVSDKEMPLIVHFTPSGKLLFKTGPKQSSDIEGTRGIFCADDDRIYMADKKNDRILVMEENGERISTFLGPDDGLEMAQSVFIDELDIVYVCQSNSKINIFKEMDITPRPNTLKS